MIDGKLPEWVIDRTFVDESGVRWIIDYKTSDHQGGDIENFFESERERYQEQLERYARLMFQRRSGRSAWGCIFRCSAGGASGPRPWFSEGAQASDAV